MNIRYDDLKITKVRFYAIHFRYKDKEYMIHDSGCCGESNIKLYRKDKNKLFFCSVAMEYFNLCDFIKCGYRYKERNITYSHIDKEYFINQMEYLGFNLENI